MKNCQFQSVLDIGGGEGAHSKIFIDYGKSVTGIDVGKSPYFARNRQKRNYIIGDFNKVSVKNRYDLVWCCHVLEHQLNVNYFLRKIRKVLMPNGILALTVPPAKSQIVGGHLSVWNAGLLLYNLVLAGFDCRDAHVLKYGYNISIVLANKK